MYYISNIYCIFELENRAKRTRLGFMAFYLAAAIAVMSRIQKPLAI